MLQRRCGNHCVRATDALTDAFQITVDASSHFRARLVEDKYSACLQSIQEFLQRFRLFHLLKTLHDFHHRDYRNGQFGKRGLLRRGARNDSRVLGFEYFEQDVCVKQRWFHRLPHSHRRRFAGLHHIFRDSVNQLGFVCEQSEKRSRCASGMQVRLNRFDHQFGFGFVLLTCGLLQGAKSVFGQCQSYFDYLAHLNLLI